MKRRTKIVCTLGPSVPTKDKIKNLIDAGMNVARINCSHGDWETRKQWITWIREISTGISPVAILVDLQGPKFRLGEIEGGSIELQPGKVVSVGNGPGVILPIHQPEILAVLTAGSRILLGDGDVEIRITSCLGQVFEAKAISGGTVKTKQGLTVVGKAFDSPCLTDKDLTDIEQAATLGADFLALSYVRQASDIRDLRRIIDRFDSSIQIIAKIETKEAINDLDEILKVADAIMVARGDMGLQMPIEDVPFQQKKIIDKCTVAGKPVITATQMLESMVRSPRPTRAETTDVANAILDGTDAVMLSGETANGLYPVECVEMMATIAEKAERIFDRGRLDSRFQERSASGVSHTEAVAYAVTELAVYVKPAAIITTTSSGQTPRLVSKFRPKAPILCATWSVRTQAQMALIWGVEAIHIDLPTNTDESYTHAVDAFVRHKRLKIGDAVIITAGVPAGMPGNTNLILTQTVA